MSEETPALLLVNAIILYLRDCELKGQSDRTIEGKKGELNQFEKWCAVQKVTHVAKVRRQHLEAYHEYLYGYRNPYTGDPLKQSTMRRKLTAVKTMFDRLYRREIVSENPARHFDLPKQPHQLPSDFLEVEEISAVLQLPNLDQPEGLRDFVMLLVLYATAARATELVSINLQDVDIGRSLMAIRKGKGARERRVPIAEIALTWLDVYIELIRPELSRLHSGSALFLNRYGERMTRGQLYYMVKKHIRRAGIDKRGASNLFRHSAPTHMHENGADIRTLKDFMGHASIVTTERYVHVLERHLRATYVKVHPLAIAHCSEPPQASESNAVH